MGWGFPNRKIIGSHVHQGVFLTCHGIGQFQVSMERGIRVNDDACVLENLLAWKQKVPPAKIPRRYLCSGFLFTCSRPTSFCKSDEWTSKRGGA